MINEKFIARIKRRFPPLGTPTEYIFRPNIYDIRTDDYVLCWIDDETVIGRISVTRMIISSVITIHTHPDNRIHNINISNIICFTRALTLEEFKEEILEFLI